MKNCEPWLSGWDVRAIATVPRWYVEVIGSSAIVYEIGVGNLNAVVLAGLTLAWYLHARGSDAASGGVLAVVTALKITPGILAWWLITQRQWTALRAFVVVGLVCLGISILGAGLDAHLQFLSILSQTSATGTSDLSLAGLGRALGMTASAATWLPRIALVAGLVSVAALYRWPRAAWAVAVATMVLGSPVVNVNWFTLLLGAIAPLAWPDAPRPKGYATSTISLLRSTPRG